MTLAGSLAMATGIGRGEASTNLYPDPADKLYPDWKKLDEAVRIWWQGDLHRADENAIRNDPKKTLPFLPNPYSSGAGSQEKFPEIYSWDTQFINLALLAHNRADIVRWHILDQFSMIDRFGKVLNGNRNFYVGRGQPPLLPWSFQSYLVAQQDDELAIRAYPSLEREYTEYWNRLRSCGADRALHLPRRFRHG
jgi:alpha,alpha-trehalase